MTSDNLTDVFTAAPEVQINTGAGETAQSTTSDEAPETVMVESAPADEAPADTAEAAPDAAQDPNAAVDAMAAATAAPAPVVDQNAPPAVPPPWFQQTMAPVNQFFQMAQQAAVQAQQKQQVAAQQQQYRQQQEQRMALRNALRPQAPDPNTTTPEGLIAWARANAEFESKCAREDAMSEVQGQLQELRQAQQDIVNSQQQRMLQEQSQRSEAFINQTIQRLTADARYPFMKNQQSQELFLHRWWAANEAAGKPVEPERVMASLLAEVRAFSGTGVQAQQRRTEAAQIDQTRRTAQNKAGAPVAPKGKTGLPGKAPDETNLAQNWWETSLRTAG